MAYKKSADAPVMALLLAYLVIPFAMLAGYVMNIITLTQVALNGDVLGTLEIVRMVGLLIFPLGAILGYF